MTSIYNYDDDEYRNVPDGLAAEADLRNQMGDDTLDDMLDSLAPSRVEDEEMEENDGCSTFVDDDEDQDQDQDQDQDRYDTYDQGFWDE